MASALILNTVQCSRVAKSGLLYIEKFLMTWVPEVVSVTISLCQLAHSLMILCNVLVLLKLIVFCTVCSTTLQTVFCKLCSMLQDKLYSLRINTLQTVFCKLCSIIVQTVHSAVLQYKLYSLQYYSINHIHSAVLQYKLYLLNNTTV